MYVYIYMYLLFLLLIKEYDSCKNIPNYQNTYLYNLFIIIFTHTQTQIRQSSRRKIDF